MDLRQVDMHSMPNGWQPYDADTDHIMRHARSPQADINFADARPPRLWAWLALLMTSAALVGMLWHYQTLQQRIAQLRQRLGETTAPQSAAPLPVALQPAWLNAQQTTSALNLPWLQTLTTLEQVQSSNPDIYLLGIQPNRNKGEIVLNGEARDFAALSAYLNALQRQFGDATLLNHKLLDVETESATLAFIIALGWH